LEGSIASQTGPTHSSSSTPTTAGGRLSRQDNGNGTYTITTYDAAGQILSIVNRAPGGSVNSRFDYTYDLLGRRITQTTIDGTWQVRVRRHGPTHQGCLHACPPARLCRRRNLLYVYDAIGNRIRTIENGVTTNYTTNNLNQYTQVGGDTLIYDADGKSDQSIGDHRATRRIRTTNRIA